MKTNTRKLIRNHLIGFPFVFLIWWGLDCWIPGGCNFWKYLISIHVAAILMIPVRRYVYGKLKFID